MESIEQAAAKAAKRRTKKRQPQQMRKHLIQLADGIEAMYDHTRAMTTSRVSYTRPVHAVGPRYATPSGQPVTLRPESQSRLDKWAERFRAERDA